MEILSFLEKYDAVTILIVVLSHQLLATAFIKKWVKAKFLVPLGLSLVLSVCWNYPLGLQVILAQAITYAGKSMIIFEIYKNLVNKRSEK